MRQDTLHSPVGPWLGLGHQLGLIMVYLGEAPGVNTYLIYGFFNTVPTSLDEARPVPEPGSPAAMVNELGLRSLPFEVDDLQALVDRLTADGYGLVGGIGGYEAVWRTCTVQRDLSWPWMSGSADAATTS